MHSFKEPSRNLIEFLCSGNVTHPFKPVNLQLMYCHLHDIINVEPKISFKKCSCGITSRIRMSIRRQ